MKPQYVLVGWLLLLVGCIDPVELPIRQVQNRLVVDGLITNEPPPYLVKLTLSGAYTSGSFPEELIINGAFVTITDQTAKRSVRLEQDPLLPSYYWLRDPAFRGQAGHSYTLSVQLPDGRYYVSQPEQMPTVPPIEQIGAYYRRGNSEIGQLDAYTIWIDTQDPPTPDNYYRWSAFGYIPRWTGTDPLHQPAIPPNPPCNECVCWVPYYQTFSSGLSDALINGNRIAHRVVSQSPVYAIGKQYVEVSQYSLTRSAFQYWNRFEEQRTRTGSLFDPQPASLEGNVHLANDSTALALGYFGASAVSKARLIIPGDTILYDRFVNRLSKSTMPAGSCSGNFSQYLLTPPTGW